MRAIGYARVSTDEQAHEGVSLDNQKAKIQAYCHLHDLELDEIIEDAGRSGKDLNRDGIQSLIERIKEREIDDVIFYKLDRLSRKVLDTLPFPYEEAQGGISQHYRQHRHQDSNR